MSHPAPIAFQALACPACGCTLDEDDAAGARCVTCAGVLVPRTWARHAFPALGRPTFSPAFIGDARTRTCSHCVQAMAPVLCHGILAWSCARCRSLFFDGAKHAALTRPGRSAPTPLPERALQAPSRVHVIVEHARHASGVVRDALGVMVLAALVLVALLLEVRPSG